MINLEIVTPEKKVLSEAVDQVTIPTANGEVGILQNHAPLISSLRSGILSYTRGGVTERMVIAGGFVEVRQNRNIILTDLDKAAGNNHSLGRAAARVRQNARPQ